MSDITNLSGLYTNYISDSASASKTQASLDVSKDYSKASDEELMDACKKFEAYFLEQVMKEMAKTVNIVESDSASMKTMTDYFKDELISKMASTTVETQSTGLAQMLYEQMKRNYDL